MIFRLAFWKTTAEAVVTTFAVTAGGQFVATGGFTAKNLIASATAGALAALAVFLKQLGASQAASATPKVAEPAPAVAK